MPPRKSVQVEGSATTTDAVVTSGREVTPAAEADQAAGVIAGQLDKADGPIAPGEQVGPVGATGDAELPVVAVTPAIGIIVRCLRERGIWRAKRFWPPESVPVRLDELAEGDLEALEAEPLLSVTAVSE